ncbi:MAG: peptide/nickel transport system substrate-binding protein, partial [Candidatus Omnitrophota bacterium]
MIFKRVISMFMISSLVMVPTPIEARKWRTSKSITFPDNKLSKENRPAHRKYSYGGTLVMGTYNAPTIINPILTSHSISAALMELIFDSLVKIDSNNKVIPGLARYWEISKDGLEYTFYLRKNVFFHDGEECTAEDVKFTHERISDPENKSHWRLHNEIVESWEIIDKHTLKIRLKRPFPLILHKLVREIAPKHLLENQNLHSNSFNYNPIGTGSFKFKHWDREINEIKLEANLDYFEGRPYLDEIIVKTYANDSYLWSAFLRGEVDLVNFVSRQDYKAIENNSAFNVYQINYQSYYALVYNLNDSIFRDKEVRKAIGFSIDKVSLIEKSAAAGLESIGPFHPGALGFNKDVEALKYDPYKGKMMLMHRGWLDAGADYNGNNIDRFDAKERGIRKKSGQSLELKILVDQSNTEYNLIAKSIRQNLSEVGVKTSVLLYQDDNELTPEYLEKHKPQAWLRFFMG